MRYRKLYQSLLASGLLFSSTQFALAGADNSDVPAGFESLLQAQETLVDVYFQGRYLTSIDASYTLSHIEFRQAQRLLPHLAAQLPEEQQAEVLAAITGELDAHQQLVCSSAQQTDCGLLQPTVAGVIFDESRFRADLFINQDLLAVQDNRSGEFLPASDGGLALLQNFGAAYSGSDSGNDYTLFGNTLLSYAESSLQAAWDVSGNNGGRVDTLFYQHDFEGREIKAGLIKPHSEGLSFAPSQSIAGIRWSSSQQTRARDLATQSSPIQIFLNSRAQVDILKDGRLLSSAIYQAGNQLLNTDRLPSGAYTVTLRISEDDGRIRSEQRYFVKEFDLPPSDYIDYFIEAGNTLGARTQALPELAGDLLLRAGLRYRLRDDLGLGIAASWLDSDTLLESSLIHVGPRHRFRGSLLWGSGGDTGYALSHRIQWNAISASIESRRLWRDDNNTTSIAPDPFTDPLLATTSSTRFELLPNAFSQHQLTFSMPIGPGSLAYSATYSQQLGALSQTIQSISYNRNLRFGDSDSVSLRAAFSHDGEQSVLTLGVNYNFQSKNWSHTVSPQLSAGGTQSENTLNWRATKSYNDGHGGDYRNTFYASAGDSSTAGYDGSYASNFGRASITLEQGLQQNEQSRVFAHASSSFITDFETIAWGGRESSGSALLIEPQGDIGDMQFDIIVNDSKQGSISANRQSVLQLTPFDTYRIRLRPNGKNLVGMDEREQQVTLYPGNVVPLTWQVSPIVIGFGRLLDAQGQPIRNAAIEGAYGVAFTDERGIFQAELMQSSDTLRINNQQYSCTAKLPTGKNRKQQSAVHNFGELRCE